MSWISLLRNAYMSYPAHSQAVAHQERPVPFALGRLEAADTHAHIFLSQSEDDSTTGCLATLLGHFPRNNVPAFRVWRFITDKHASKMLQLVAAFSVLALASASDVLDLTDSDFSSRLADEELALVKFYAPWWDSLRVERHVRDI